MEELLKNLRVLNTRPKSEAVGLNTRIREQGGIALEAPLMEIVPVAIRPEDSVALGMWNGNSMAIFISRNAVHYGAPLLAPLVGAQGGKIYAIGPATAKALATVGLKGALTGKSGFDSESLLALPALAPETVGGRRVFLFRGRGGRELIGQALAERGALVTPLCIYERRTSKVDLADLFLVRRPHAVVVTSTENLTVLDALLVVQKITWLRDLPLIVPSERVAQTAREAGYARIYVAPDPTEEGLYRGLLSYAEERRIESDEEAAEKKKAASKGGYNPTGGLPSGGVPPTGGMFPPKT